MTIIDGIVRTQRSRNTPPAGKVPEVVSGQRPAKRPFCRHSRGCAASGAAEP